jgi:hypothetical protein
MIFPSADDWVAAWEQVEAIAELSHEINRSMRTVDQEHASAPQVVHVVHCLLPSLRSRIIITGRRRVFMPTIITLGNVAIRMFADDHNPPHFHIVTPRYQALVALSSMSVVAGEMDRRSLDVALEWAREHKALLEQEWNRLNER